ncbi:MAG: amidohydrolase [Sphingobacteriaceae bacterium]|nr:MAG: amidohydrolase [Sphingobacteriaceae bacterium]
MKKTLILCLGASITAVLLFAFSPAKTVADKLYINGKIITVDSANSIAQAVAIKDGKILAVGTTAAISKLKGSKTVVVDLKGQTLIPGLIDGHSHFMGLGSAYADLSPPPVNTIKSIPDIIAALQKFKAKNKLNDGDWITGFGYDQDQMVEKRHPVKEDLDAAFPNNPVIIAHISGHMMVANSAAFKAAGVDANTPDPAGGKIVRKPGSNEPAGLLQETAAGIVRAKATQKKVSPEDQLEQLKNQQEMYASFGITTAQDGYSSLESLKLLKMAADKNALFIDIDALAGYAILDSVMNPAYNIGAYNNHFKIAGFKLVADGSPQGKTAFFSKPYLTEVPGCNHDLCTGIPTVTQQQIDAAVKKGFENNIRPFVHCNGDATVDMYIKAVEKASTELKLKSEPFRPVVIHSQFVRTDELDKYKQLGMLPAMFTNHAFFWGDIHVTNLGKERAYFLSPAKTAIKKGIVFTNHTDFPVTPINQMFLLWTSVARQSRSGQVIGADEKLTPMEGLRAITINGAYEYKEEKTKGSIEPGKLADLAILSADPLTIDADKIKDITVLETIKEGKTVFKRN